MPPEAFDGAPATPAADVYGVGVLLFYLVSAPHPYEGQTFDDIRDAHASRRANPLLPLRPDLPVRFANVVDRALSIDPADRYQTPAEVQTALVAARTLTLTWPQLLYRLALFVVFILVLMLVGGMISSAAFNSRFGRAQYASESLGDWFELGFRSLLMPVVLSLIGTLLVGGALAFRNIAVKTSGALRSLDRRLRQGCIVLAERLSLRDATVCASWLVMLTALGLLGIWLNFRQLLHTLSIDWITVPAQSLSILTPAYLEHRTHYRMALGLLAAANVTGCVRPPTGHRGAVDRVADVGCRDGIYGARPSIRIP